MKVFELAKQLNIKSLDLVDQLKNLGFSIKNHMSLLTEEDTKKIISHFEKKVTEKDSTITKKVSKKKSTDQAATQSVRKKIVRKNTQEVTEETPLPLENITLLEVEEISPEELPIEETFQEPQAVETPPQEEIISIEEETAPVEIFQEEEESVFKEKLHAFTPIFTPVEKTTPPAITTHSPLTSGVVDHTKTPTTTTFTAPKKGKIKDVTLIKADEELKFASNILGRSVYTPIKKKSSYAGDIKETLITRKKDEKRIIKVENGLTVLDLCLQTGISFEDFAIQALKIHLLIKKTDYLGFKLAQKLANLLDYKLENTSISVQSILKNEEQQQRKKRHPIVTVMGHVDHGKTTLLDFLRKTRVVSQEAGGITQHIGAYQVFYKKKAFTFLDTPGHAAFTSMRERGAQVTDIVILVVAADDGIMPQTIEAIRVLQEAKVEVIVAINKIDKEGANSKKIKEALLEYSLVAEEWGGSTQMVEISALKGIGIDALMEAIDLQADLLELTASDTGFAKGMVIESHLEQGRGVISTVLVQEGTLKIGDIIFSGTQYTKVRSLVSDAGKIIKEAGPSLPVQVLGFKEITSPGEIFQVLPSEKEAKHLVESKKRELEDFNNISQKKTLEDFFNQQGSDEKKVMNLIIKADVQGSLEAIVQSLQGLGNEQVGLKILVSGIGAINDNDILTAKNTSSYIIGFNVRPTTSAKKLSDEKAVDIKTYSIIYKLIEEVSLALQGLLDPIFIENYLGRAEVRKVFQLPKGLVAGCMVVDGKVDRQAEIRILREGKILHEGKITSLKRFKEDVKEVRMNQDCGIGIESFQDLKENDLFEFFTKEKKTQLL